MQRSVTVWSGRHAVSRAVWAPLAAGWNRWVRARGGGRSGARWLKTLALAIEDLEGLNRETERQFLTMGARLADFVDGVESLSSGYAAVAALLAGEQGPRALEALTGVLERSRELSLRTGEGRALLSSMRQDVCRLKAELSEFKSKTSTFHTIGVLTRVEITRLGSEGAAFGNLADDVRSLAQDVQERIQLGLKAAAGLVQSVESLLRVVSEQQEGQARELPALISGALSSLASFREMQTRTREATSEFGSRYAAISRSVSQAIVSMQFQDITRQQVEHVIEALRKLHRESSSGATRDGLANSGVILTLQAMQLADAGNKFTASVASVEGNLDAISSNVLEMAGEGQELVGASEGEKNSFFAEMERRSKAILAMLRACSTAEEAAQATGEHLVESIRQMSGVVDQIRESEERIVQMALNANIRATQIGVPGAALGVLASSLHRLAIEYHGASESLAEALGRMTADAGGLSGSYSGREPQGVEQLASGVRDLQESSEKSSAQLALNSHRSIQLRDEIAAARHAFSIGAHFAETIQRTTGRLREIGGEVQAGNIGKADLAHFAGRYTMQSEHEVHERAFGGSALGVSRAAVGAGTFESREPDTGDVEFF